MLDATSDDGYTVPAHQTDRRLAHHLRQVLTELIGCDRDAAGVRRNRIHREPRSGAGAVHREDRLLADGEQHGVLGVHMDDAGDVTSLELPDVDERLTRRLKVVSSLDLVRLEIDEQNVTRLGKAEANLAWAL